MKKGQHNTESKFPLYIYVPVICIFQGFIKTFQKKPENNFRRLYTAIIYLQHMYIVLYQKEQKETKDLRQSENILRQQRGGIQKFVDKLNIFFMHFRIFMNNSHLRHE